MSRRLGLSFNITGLIIVGLGLVLLFFRIAQPYIPNNFSVGSINFSIIIIIIFGAFLSILGIIITIVSWKRKY